MKARFARIVPAVLILYMASLLAIAPQATAQNGPLTVEMTVALQDNDSQLNGGRLPPESGSARYKITTTVNVPPGVACIVPINVVYKVNTKPAYSAVVITPQSQSKTFYGATEPPTSGAAQDPVVFETFATVTITRQAPALQDMAFQIQADASAASAGQGACNLTAGVGKGDFTIKADYLSLMQYNPSNYILKTGQNKGVNFGIKFINFGNGPTKVKIKADMPSKNKLDSLIPPADQHLEAKQTQGAGAKDTADIVIQARTPHSNGYTNSFYNILATFDASYDGNIVGGTPSTDNQQVTLSVQVQGVYVPGFDAVSLIAALGAALGLFVPLSRRK